MQLFDGVRRAARRALCFQVMSRAFDGVRGGAERRIDTARDLDPDRHEDASAEEQQDHDERGGVPQRHARAQATERQAGPKRDLAPRIVVTSLRSWPSSILLRSRPTTTSRTVAYGS